jgi:hypothetical protein
LLLLFGTVLFRLFVIVGEEHFILSTLSAILSTFVVFWLLVLLLFVNAVEVDNDTHLVTQLVLPPGFFLGHFLQGAIDHDQDVAYADLFLLVLLH